MTSPTYSCYAPGITNKRLKRKQRGPAPVGLSGILERNIQESSSHPFPPLPTREVGNRALGITLGDNPLPPPPPRAERCCDFFCVQNRDL